MLHRTGLTDSPTIFLSRGQLLVSKMDSLFGSSLTDQDRYWDGGFLDPSSSCKRMIVYNDLHFITSVDQSYHPFAGFHAR